MVICFAINPGHCLGFNALVKLFRVLLLASFVFVFIAACAIKDGRRHYGYHLVEKGDTLYSISWRYGLDAKQVARWNGLSRPYTIFPGQRLKLSPGGSSIKSAAKKSDQNKITKKKKVVAVKAPGDWRWPVKGKIVQKFSNSNNGIDVVAKEGAAINAASAGKVVYAGSGLRGYGNLLIIKHNATYFSAYAHSRRLLVKEGSIVKAGQKIAEVGSTGTDRVKLHFEIRRDGNPVDPLKYLPR